LTRKNTAVNVYLDKLFVNTTKFKVMPEYYVSYQNPAYLGLIKKDQVYFTGSSMGSDNIVMRNSVSGVVEKADKTSAGYFFPVPLIKGLGFGVEGTGFSTKDMIWGRCTNCNGSSGSMVVAANNQVSYSGAVLTAGLQLSENISLGAGFTSYSEDRNYDIGGALINGAAGSNVHNTHGYKDINTSGLTAQSVGLLLKNEANTLFFDAYYAATSQKTEFYNVLTGSFDQYKMPSVQENTLTYAFNQKKSFIVLKQTNYIYPAVSGIPSSSISKYTPAAEHWFSTWLALRAGAEFSRSELAGAKSSGSGLTAGATLSLKHLFDIDVNFTDRARPSRNFNDMTIKEKVIFATLSTNSGIFSRSDK